jgi:hypothetical protein
MTQLVIAGEYESVGISANWQSAVFNRIEIILLSGKARNTLG